MDKASGNGALFYQRSMGRMVRHLIARKLKPMLDDQTATMTSAGLGYVLPYFKYFPPSATPLHFQTTGHDLTPWTGGGALERSRQAVVDLTQLPVLDASLDLALVIHGLETTSNPDAMMEEAWRILKGQGRLIMVVPHRASLWSMQDFTPFGHGQPYSINQLKRLVKQHGFEIAKVKQALFAPPSRSNFYPKFAPLIERMPKVFGGVLIIEAQKMVYSKPSLEAREKRKTVRGLVQAKAL